MTNGTYNIVLEARKEYRPMIYGIYRICQSMVVIQNGLRDSHANTSVEVGQLLNQLRHRAWTSKGTTFNMLQISNRSRSL